LYACGNPVNHSDPTGKQTADLVIAVGISGLLSGIVGGVTSKALGGGLIDGFFRGFISGSVSSALILGSAGAFPPTTAFGLGNALGDIVVDAAATDAASLMQMLRFGFEGAIVREAVNEIGVLLTTAAVTGFSPAVLDRLVDLTKEAIDKSKQLFENAASQQS
jgi:hypothetical protein